MKQKGVYPYDYMDSFDKFNEKRLPQKEDFFSLLNNEEILVMSNTHMLKTYRKNSN